MNSLNLYKAKIGTIVTDKKDNSKWEFIGNTLAGNYSCSKIKNLKSGVIRKLSIFEHDNGPRDYARYVLGEGERK